MGIRLRQKNLKERGEKAWWVFVNYQGKRFSLKAGAKKTAKEIAREFERTLAVYKGQQKLIRKLEELWTKHNSPRS